MGNKLGVFLAGGLVGAAAALLCAPRSGRETRTLVADKVNEAWGEAQNLGTQAGSNVQQAYQTATARGQEVAQGAVARGQEFAQAAQARGQQIYGQATARVQEVASNINPGFGQRDDELRAKIEAARQRIANQVAQNAEQSSAAAESTIPVSPEATEAAAPAAPATPAEQPVEGAAPAEGEGQAPKAAE